MTTSRSATIGSIFFVADGLELDAEAVADHHQRLAEAHVLDLAGGDGGAELFLRHAGADFALQRLASRRGVLDADDVDLLHILADRGDRQRQLVHDEAGIHAGAEERDVRGAGHVVQLLADFLIERERQLLAGGDDMAAALEERFQLCGHVAQTRAGRVTDDVGLHLQLGRDFHADLFVETDHFAEVTADFLRIDVDRGDELDPRLGQEEPRDLGADRADAVLRDGDGSGRAHGRRIVADGERMQNEFQ